MDLVQMNRSPPEDPETVLHYVKEHGIENIEEFSREDAKARVNFRDFPHGHHFRVEIDWFDLQGIFRAHVRIPDRIIVEC